MLKKTLPLLTLVMSALLSQPVLAEKYPDTRRPIDHFVNGEEILTVDSSPWDDSIWENTLAAVSLRDNISAQDNFVLAKAIFTIGRTDLLGLNRSLDSFDTGTLETPLGGHFEETQEQVAGFKTARAQRASRGLDGFNDGGFASPLRGNFAIEMEQAIQFKGQRAVRAGRGLNRLGYRSGF